MLGLHTPLVKYNRDHSMPNSPTIEIWYSLFVPLECYDLRVNEFCLYKILNFEIIYKYKQFSKTIPNFPYVKSRIAVDK